MAYTRTYLGTNTSLSGLTFTNSAAFIIDRGNQTVVGALDQSAVASATDVLFGEYATVNFKGTDGSPFKMKVTRNFLIKQPGGVIFYTPVATTAKLQNIGATKLSLIGGTLTNCENGGQGDLTIGATTIVTNLYIVGGSCYQDVNATANTVCKVDAGSLVTERNITTFTQAGGSTTFGRADGSLTGNTITTLNAFGGSFTARGAVGAISNLTGYGNTFFDFRGCTQDLTIGGGGVFEISAAVRDQSYFKSSKATITLSNLRVVGSENQNVSQ